MAFLSKTFYSGNGLTDQFTITFDYQLAADVVVTVDGVVQVADTNYSISGTTLTFLAGSIPPSGVDNIEIRRATPTVPRVDFANSGIITEAKLDKQNLQNSYIVEEVKDANQSNLGLNAENDYDAGGLNIVDVADPADAQDAATKSYVDAVATGTLPGPLPIAQGGTNAATAAAARTNLDVYSKAEADVPSSQVTAAIAASVDDLSGVTNPSGARVNIGAQQNVTTARGDLVRGGAGGLVERLPIGVAGQLLKSDGIDAVWASAASSFFAYRSGDQANVTGNGTLADVVFNTELFDIGSDFDTTTGVFTAPITGRYAFAAAVTLTSMTGATDVLLRLVATAVSVNMLRMNPNGSLTSPAGSMILSLTAGDTVKCQVFANGVGADTADIDGITTPITSYFSGHLLP